MEREAFDRLLLDHLPVAQRFAIRLCGNATEAEDMLHDALVRVAAKWATFRGESSFRTWLFQVVVNVFRDRLRARERQADQAVERESLPGVLEDRHATDPSRNAEHRETGEIIAQAVSTLPRRQREVIVLSAYEQLSSGEIAGVLDMTEQNVRTTLHLARERLRTRLAKHLGVTHEH